MEIERRSMLTELRVMDGAEGKAPVLGGYAAVFNVLSQEMGPGGKRFKERLMPGSFRTTLLSGDEVLAFYHHGLAGGMMGATMPLGSTKDGSLRLSEDAHGLAFSLDLPATTQGKDLEVLARRGTVRGASFAFSRAKDTWHRDDAGLIRTVHEIVGLQDVSPTHSPAYEETVIAVRSMDAWARATSSSGEVSWEQKQEAIEAALEDLLGKRWTEGVDTWYVIAIFDSSVVVEQSGKMQSYPVTWAGGTPALGKPVPVDQVFQEAAQAKRASESRARRLRLLEIDAGIRAVSGATGLPLADRERAWDATGAANRVAKWASSDSSGDKDKVSWSKYARAFFWVNPEMRDAFGGYKLGFADVLDGALTAIPRGVFACAAVMRGSRGGVQIPAGDRDGVKSRIAGYYRAMAAKFEDEAIVPPWEG